MMPANDAVLDSLEQSLFNPQVLRAAVTGAVAELAQPADGLNSIHAELSSLTIEIDRLTSAIAAGGSLESLMAALQAREHVGAICEPTATTNRGR